MKFFLSSKIHNAVVTDANLSYAGSITIDKTILDKAGLQIGEKVLVVSNTTGARLETYVIEGEPGSRTICMNGAASHLIKKGEHLIIMGFTLSDRSIDHTLLVLDSKNNIQNIET